MSAEYNGQEFVKRLCNTTGLSQKEIAEKLNISAQSVTNWKTGKVRPNIEYLITLANEFGFSVDSLLGMGEAKRNYSVSDICRVLAVCLRDMNISVTQKGGRSNAFSSAVIGFVNNYNKLMNVDFDKNTKESVLNALINGAQQEFESQKGEIKC